MQISANSNTLALSLLQRLLQSGESNSASAASSAGQPASATGQNSPGAAALSGCGGPQLAPQTLSSAVSLQTQPQASSLASNLISALDTDGDGQVSLSEIQQGLSKAGFSTDVTQAFQSLDKNGDGKLSSDELASGIQTAQAHRHHGGHGHHMAANIAQDLISAADTDGDGQLSIAEINSARGQSSTDATTQGFSSLDTNGDGKLSSDELTTAIQANIQQALQAYAQQQSASQASVAAA